MVMEWSILVESAAIPSVFGLNRIRIQKAVTSLPQTSPSRNAMKSHVRLLLMLGVSTCLWSCLGCQTFCPFTKNAQQNLASARQWASGGVDAYHHGRLDQAKGLLSQAVQQNPSDASVREDYARALLQSGETDQALEQMRFAVELSKGDPRVAVELGTMYLDSGRWLPARRQVELAIERDHRFAPAWALSGKTEKSKGNYEKALADFQRALSYAPDLPGVQIEIVDTYQKMGEHHQALSAIEQILHRYPADEFPENLVLAKSVALMKIDQLRPAIDLLQTASKRQEASSEVFVRLGQAQLLAGQVSQARLTLNRGKQAFPNLVVFDQLVDDLQTAQQSVAATDNSFIR